MIYAIPNDNGEMSKHFMKASKLSFFDDATFVNEVNVPKDLESGGCHSRKEFFNLLTQFKAEAVIVKNIGEQALNRLFSAGIRVFQVNEARALSEVSQSPLQELSSIEQARPSLRFRRKQGGCCGSEKQAAQGRHAHRQKHACSSAQGKRRGHCCGHNK